MNICSMLCSEVWGVISLYRSISAQKSMIFEFVLLYPCNLSEIIV